MVGFSLTDKVSDHYDSNADFADGLINMIPDFEYPNWSHRTIAEVLKSVAAPHIIESSLSGLKVESKHYSERILDELVAHHGWKDKAYSTKDGAIRYAGVLKVNSNHELECEFDGTGRYLSFKKDGDVVFDVDCRDRDVKGVAKEVQERAGIAEINLNVPGFSSFRASRNIDGSHNLSGTAKVNGEKYFFTAKAVIGKDGASRLASPRWETFTGQPVRGAANVKLEDLGDAARVAALSLSADKQAVKDGPDAADLANPRKKYYVTMIRNPGPTQRVALLAGPFIKHDDALALVDRARNIACEVDPLSHWDAFGTSGIESDNHRPGTLNGKLGVSAKIVDGGQVDLSKLQDKLDSAFERVTQTYDDYLSQLVTDPVSPEGYPVVLADKKLQLRFQDQLDAAFGGRIVNVRNALRDKGWHGAPRAISLLSPDSSFSVSFKPVQVGAGANVVGGSWKILAGTHPFKKWREVAELKDDLVSDPAEMASAIDRQIMMEKELLGKIAADSELAPETKVILQSGSSIFGNVGVVKSRASEDQCSGLAAKDSGEEHYMVWVGDNSNNHLSLYSKNQMELASVLPHQITSAQFAKFATAIPLENHGRKWQVVFGEHDCSFCDSPTKEGALREAHLREVNNAIYSHIPGELMEKASFPPKEVLAEYPHLIELFADVFKARETVTEGAYVGKILSVDFKEGVAIQKVGRSNQVIVRHDLSKLGGYSLKENDLLDIQYFNGSAKVKNLGQDKGIGL